MKLHDILESGLDFDKMLKNKDADPKKDDERKNKEQFDQQSQRLRSAQRKNKKRD